MSVKAVLFLCTGNYYRSRFAEGLFNHLALQRQLNWRADSRGLKLGGAETNNVGPISLHTLAAFKRLSIPVTEPIRYSKTAIPDDFALAELIVALKEDEHRALVRKHFPDWEHRITYWHVHDVDRTPPHLALAEIETLVRDLIGRL
jgi:protein-tyrosine phosphatase